MERWRALVALLIWSWMTMTQTAIWFTFSAVDPVIVTGFIPTLTQYQLRLLLAWGSVPPLFGTIPSIFVVSRYGFRHAYFWAAACQIPLLFVCIMYCYFPDTRSNWAAVVALHTACIINGLCTSFAVGAVGSFFECCFHPSSHTACLSLVVTASGSGLVVPYIISLVFVKHASQMTVLLNAAVVMIALSVLGCIFFLRRISPGMDRFRPSSQTRLSSFAAMARSTSTDAIERAPLLDGPSSDDHHLGHAFTHSNPALHPDDDVMAAAADDAAAADADAGHPFSTTCHMSSPTHDAHHHRLPPTLLDSSVYVAHTLWEGMKCLRAVTIIAGSALAGSSMGLWGSSTPLIFGQGGAAQAHCGISDAAAVGLGGTVMGVSVFSGLAVGAISKVAPQSLKVLQLGVLVVGVVTGVMLVAMIDSPPCPSWMSGVCHLIPTCTTGTVSVLAALAGLVAGACGPLCCAMAMELVYPEEGAVATELYTVIGNVEMLIFLFIPAGSGLLSLQVRAMMGCLVGFACIGVVKMEYLRSNSERVGGTGR